MNKIVYDMPYYSQVSLGQHLYSVSKVGIQEWSVYSVTFSPAVRSLRLIRYVNNVFQEIISIVDTRLGIDFFLPKQRQKRNLKY